MKGSIWGVAVVIVAMLGCGGKHIPDVSGIKVDLEMQRFDRDFFALDTNHVDQSLQQLQEKYPGFLRDFLYNILALPPHAESSANVERQVVSFLRSYAPLKDSSDKIF